MDVSGPHFPLNDQETAWKALVAYGLEAQTRHIEQSMGKIGQVIGEMNQPDVDRSICVKMMREFAQIVMRDVEGLMAFSQIAETMIQSQPPDASLTMPAPVRETVEQVVAAKTTSRAKSAPKDVKPKVDPLQSWRDASDPEFVNHLKEWMEAVDISQDELCRVLEYKPVYVTRIMRGTDPVTARFKERLLEFVATRKNGRSK